MSLPADDYRKKQEECVEQAKKARNSADKAQWLRIGEEWARLADTEESETQPSKQQRASE